MKISSTQFENGGWMPDTIAGYGEDMSPDIIIDGLPEDTVSIAVTMDDLDHPIKPGFNHWVAWNIEPACRIPGGIPKGGVMETPIHIEQGIGYGRYCYRGPKPPFDGNHRYTATVYALDIKLKLGSNSRKKDLLSAIDNHILGRCF